MKGKSPWKRLSEFVTRINESVETQEQPGGKFAPILEKWASGDVFFSNRELGGLMLSRQESTEYRTCVKAIHELLADKRGQISAGAIENAIQVAMLKALDMNKMDSEPDFTKRLAREVEELKRSLTSKQLDTYVVRLEVQGLDPKDLPSQFGGIKSYVADEITMPELAVRTGIPEDSRDEVRKKRIESSRILKSNIMASVKGRTYAEIEVEAFDSKATAFLAERQLSRTLDVLNYFSDFFSHEAARVFLPGDATTSRHVAVVGKKGDAQSHRFEFSHKGPLFPFSFPSKDSPPKSVDAFSKASTLLQRRARNSLDERILAALQWAGRASTEGRKDKAFLHFCISLEALLSKEDRGEIVFAFALRGAHLLLQDAGMRGKLFDDLKTLYGLRSKIVHVGKTDVSDSDLAIIRELARQAIFIVLVTEPFASMTASQELDRWFQEQQLAGVRIVERNPEEAEKQRRPS